MEERTLSKAMCELNGWKVYDLGNEVVVEKSYEETVKLVMKFSVEKLLSSVSFVNMQGRVYLGSRVIYSNAVNQEVFIKLGEEIRASGLKVIEDEGEIRLSKEYYDVYDDILLIKVSARFDREFGFKYKLEVEEDIYYIKGTSSNALRHNSIKDEIYLGYD